jgi:hypothetical protein
MIRESYEQQIYSTLLEMDVTTAGGKILVDAGLEVTEIKTGKKFTVQSVQKNGNDVIVNLISPENIAGPITSVGSSTSVSPGQPSHSCSIEEFEKKYKV